MYIYTYILLSTLSDLTCLLPFLVHFPREAICGTGK